MEPNINIFIMCKYFPVKVHLLNS